MKILAQLLPFALFAPLFVFAQVTPGNFQGVSVFISNIMGFINNILIPFVFAIAFLVFIWGMFKTFILGGSDEDKQKEGKHLMMYAIAGFVIMISLWGIVNIVAQGFGFQGSSIQTPVTPSLKN